MIFTQDNWLMETFGWTLLHSLWQGAIIAITFSVVLRLMKTATANARYLAACAALCMFAALPAVTFVRLAKPTPKDCGLNEEHFYEASGFCRASSNG